MRALTLALTTLLVAACGSSSESESPLSQPPAAGAGSMQPAAAGSASDIDASAPVAGTGSPQPQPAAGTVARGSSGEGGASGVAGRAAESGSGGVGGSSGAGGSGGSTAPPIAGASGAMPVAGSSAPSSGVEPASCTRTDSGGAVPTVYVIGDSTASVYGADLYPRMGWAQPLQDYFAAACARIQDKALSGRSSKSFYDEGAWTPIREALHAGDFVLIQFGHNDEKSDDPARYTEPSTTYKQFLTRYVDDTEAKGATAILMTSIERNKWSNGQLGSTHGAYPDAVRALAEARKLTLVDMTKLTHSHFQQLGQSATTALFMNLSPGQFPNYPNGNSDDTHLQERGAHVVAEIALAELARQRVPLAALLKSVPKL